MRLVKPKKFLGQHFLKDLKVAQDIADTVDACPNLPILEVGPGMGVLTQFLLPKERTVKVVEVDYESVAYLREAYPQLEDNIIEDDFLKMNLQRLFDGQPFVLTGNYPYNISSQIFFKMLDNKELIPCCTGMIQKEVAERIAAGPGSKTYGILSVPLRAETVNFSFFCRLFQCCFHQIGQFYKLLYGKLLGAFVEERVFGQRTFFAEYRFYGITQGFPALVECSFYNLFKQLFVTSQK